jgi:TRAP-type C4-dicarboxylate transport system substrate-binding protein
MNTFDSGFFGHVSRFVRQALTLPACIAAGALVVAPLALLPSAHAQEVEIKLITGFPFDGPSGDKMYGAKLFIERFNAKAKGQARIRVVGGPEVVAPFDQLKALQAGQFDAMVTSQGYFNEMLGLQFINYMTSDEQVKAMPKGYLTLQKISREGAGVVLVQLSSPGLPFYLWSREAKPITTLADFKGLKLRGNASVNAQMAKYLGLVPTNLPSNDVYSALRGGILDGAMRDSLSIEVLNEGEYLKHRSNARLADFSSELYLSNKAWDALSPAVRQIMNTVARETETEALEWMKVRVQRTDKLLTEKYKVKVASSPADVNDIIGRRIGGELIKQIVGGSKYAAELTENFSLQPYLKD